MCSSASTLVAVHPAVSKLITVIRLKRGERGTSWPRACFLRTSPVRQRASLQLSYWDPASQTPAPNDRLTLLLFVWNPHRGIQLHPCLHNDRPVIGEPFWYIAILARVCNPFILVHTNLFSIKQMVLSSICGVFAQMKHKQWSKDKKTDDTSVCVHRASEAAQEHGVFINVACFCMGQVF